jgi:chromosome segregation ATPase
MEPQLPQSLQQLEGNLRGLALNKESSTQVSQASIASLQASINDLLLMFTRANEELTLEQREEMLFKTHLDPVMKKLDELADQQETLASAIISISDAIDKLSTSIVQRQLKSTDHNSDIQILSTPSMPTQAKPNFQRFSWTGNKQTNANLPPVPPPPPTQAIPVLRPNALGESNSFF